MLWAHREQRLTNLSPLVGTSTLLPLDTSQDSPSRTGLLFYGDPTLLCVSLLPWQISSHLLLSRPVQNSFFVDAPFLALPSLVYKLSHMDRNTLFHFCASLESLQRLSIAYACHCFITGVCPGSTWEPQTARTAVPAVQASHCTRDLPEGRGAEIQPMLLSPSPASWQKAEDHQRGHFSAIRITVLDRLMILWKTL